METPALPPPDNDRDREVLSKLSQIRDQLVLLKTDRTTYLRSQEVIPLYNETVEQVLKLDNLGFVDGKPQTQRRNNEAPAVYAPTTTMLSSLNVNRDQACPRSYVTLLTHRIELCRTSLTALRERLNRLEDPLPDIYERIISLIRTISRANTRPTVSVSEVTGLQKKAQEIAEQRQDGNFVAEDGRVPAGNDIVNDVLSRCLGWSEAVLERKGAIPDGFKPLYDKLILVRNHLEKLSVTHAWALREADLYDYHRTLDRIDDLRVNGNWVDDQGNEADVYVRRMLLYLIRRSYGFVFQLMMASQPVSEALLPVYNQLKTLKRCLTEVRDNGGIRNLREVYPYSMKLNSIDNMRKDGKFMVGDDIPEGQGRVTELLEDCFDLSQELKIAAEDAEAKAKEAKESSSTDLESRTASEAESDAETDEETEDDANDGPIMKPHNNVPISA
ncbi:unnamed protein product [Parascedosporium putredinis]|uniref:Uncharacterized protein n=1 Tax=Parascedosporium putredinis TaxID=1442378 RepID=A0A9P1H3K5_9PEZI|nr:unnamed protein product [Parascedosporium putredinis]CAI7995868.1 unnamed protein product [Parascedosporium putredinis]